MKTLGKALLVIFIISIISNIMIIAGNSTRKKEEQKGETTVSTTEEEKGETGTEIISFDGYNKTEKYSSFTVKHDGNIYERRYFDNGDVIEIRTLS